MKTIMIFAVAAYLWVFGYHYKTLVSNGIPAGHVIKEGDIARQRGFYMSPEQQDFATDPAAVIGHKALKELHAGGNIRMSDIQ